MVKLKALSVALLGTMSAAFAAPGIESAAAVSFTETESINFNRDHNGKKLKTGTGQIIDGAGLFKNNGLKLGVRTKEGNNNLLLFNSNCEGKLSKGGTCTGDDDDLATGATYGTKNQKNVLIIQENLKDKNGNDKNSIFDPDDKVKGTFIFDFTDKSGVLFKNIGLLDLDETHIPTFTFFYTDGTSKLLQESDYKVAIKNDMSQITDEDVKKDVEKGENSLRNYTFNKFNTNVAKLEMWIPGSGAVTNLKYKRKVPEPTSALALIGGVVVAGRFLKRKNSEVKKLEKLL
ncbi:MAG: hypothetical protein AAF208_02865 [Cyanobacteria bacterium P01_A01_bin.45]